MERGTRHRAIPTLPDAVARPLAWWSSAFATCALAALAGALHHGLGHELPAAVNRAVWRFAVLSLVATGHCLMQVAAGLVFSGPALVVAQLTSVLASGLLAVHALRVGTFGVAIRAYGLGQLLVLAAAVSVRHSHSPAHLAWIAAGVATSALAAGIQHFRLGPHPRFNHNDLYHVVQAAAQGCFYFGAVAADA